MYSMYGVKENNVSQENLYVLFSIKDKLLRFENIFIVYLLLLG